MNKKENDDEEEEDKNKEHKNEKGEYNANNNAKTRTKKRLLMNFLFFPFVNLLFPSLFRTLIKMKRKNRKTIIV